MSPILPVWALAAIHPRWGHGDLAKSFSRVYFARTYQQNFLRLYQILLGHSRMLPRATFFFGMFPANKYLCNKCSKI